MRSAVIGLVPAAGTASRLGRLPGSKEVLPLWRGSPSAGPLHPPRPVCECLLHHFETAGIERTLIVLRSGKEDIPACLGDRTGAGMAIDYVTATDSPTPAFTLDAAYGTVRGATVAMGLPDLIFDAPGAFERLLDHLDRGAVDVVLGLFPHPVLRRADVVEVDTGYNVSAVLRSGQPRSDTMTWGVAAWRPSFTEFLHRHLAGPGPAPAPERGLSQVFTAAIGAGLAVGGLTVSSQPFLDIGTPPGLEEAFRRLERR
jgi:glucose-1-phosphate thymidylyltransferase